MKSLEPTTIAKRDASEGANEGGRFSTTNCMENPDELPKDGNTDVTCMAGAGKYVTLPMLTTVLSGKTALKGTVTG